MIAINDHIQLADDEVQWQFIRASGPGGQHVNKTSTAVLLTFEIASSSLPSHYKDRLLRKADHRISQSGKLLIKCQQSRSQDHNRQLALAQFVSLVASCGITPKQRKATKPSFGSQQRRLQQKKQHGATKANRQQKPQSYD